MRRQDGVGRTELPTGDAMVLSLAETLRFTIDACPLVKVWLKNNMILKQ